MMQSSWHEKVEQVRRLWRLPQLVGISRETERRLGALEDRLAALQHGLGAIGPHLAAQQRCLEAMERRFDAQQCGLEAVDHRLAEQQRYLEVMRYDLAHETGCRNAEYARAAEFQQCLEKRLLGLRACFDRSESELQGVKHATALIQRATVDLQTESRRVAVQTEDCLRDLITLALGRVHIPQLIVQLQSDHPVAAESPDHYAPRGTARDNTRHQRFVRRCEQHYHNICHLDIGCAGGGLVWDFAVRGHRSVGIEGSDFSLKSCRAEWRTIPDRLFTADITQPFGLYSAEGERLLFNIITAWEVFEHIPPHRVSATIGHLLASLASDGILVCSIATFVDVDETTGVVYHQTVRSRDWWIDQFGLHGLAPVDGLFEVEDFVRGSGNPSASDWDVRSDPEMGFHLVLQYRQEVASSARRQ
jgi:hypothetical protein